MLHQSLQEPLRSLDIEKGNPRDSSLVTRIEERIILTGMVGAQYAKGISTSLCQSMAERGGADMSGSIL